MTTQDKKDAVDYFFNHNGQDFLNEQNRKDSGKVAFFNETTWDGGIASNNQYPMPGQKVYFFGGCKTREDVERAL